MSNPPTTSLGTFVRDACGTFLVPFTIRSLQRAATNVNSVDDAIALAYNFQSCQIRIAPGQVPAEITSLLKVLAQRPPRRLLEIGTAGGGTFFLLSRVAAEDALLISADLPLGLFGGGYPKWRGRLIKSFRRPKQELHLLRVDSHVPQTLEHVKQLLNGRLLDFLFIDGDHRYEGVKRDLEMYSPLVMKGGLIGFHDIVPGPENNVGGVPKFWQELKQTCPAREFVADWKQGGYGIGLIET
jgi:predicted O-methyltransferase YrrM